MGKYQLDRLCIKLHVLDSYWHKIRNYIQDIMEKPEFITTKYSERFTLIQEDGKPVNKDIEHELKTCTKVPKLGFMMVGLGGNNGTTVTAGILANKKKLKWDTKRGEAQATYYGSFTQCVTTKIGTKMKKVGEDLKIEDVYLPIKDLLPMVNPSDVVIGGWDISGMNGKQRWKESF